MTGEIRDPGRRIYCFLKSLQFDGDDGDDDGFFQKIIKLKKN
jgi:hypothetical protein